MKGELTEQAYGNILKRMLLLGSQVQGTEWSQEHSCCLNILATRVQMGQTSVEIASNLVGGAYANLVGVDDKKKPKRIYYPPDPVCARLAMCLMDENWSFQLSDGRTIEGMKKALWAQEIGILFSNRIFTVEKGFDFGEVLVAFYFLLCADEIRGTLGDDYCTFSVSLKDWIRSLYSVDESCSDEALKEEVKCDSGDDLMDDADDSVSIEDERETSSA